MWRYLLLAMFCWAFLCAQDRGGTDWTGYKANLSRPVDSTNGTASEGVCGVLSSVNMPGGVVTVSDECANPNAIRVALTDGVSLRDALESITAAQPGFRWAIADGVVNVLPEVVPDVMRRNVGRFEWNTADYNLVTVGRLFRESGAEGELRKSGWAPDTPGAVDLRAYLAQGPGWHCSVLPGASLHIYRNGADLEYDWIVAPRADPRAVRMRFGSRHLQITAAGDLLISQPGSVERHTRPIAYQIQDGRRIPVAVRFAIVSEGVAGFLTGEYNRDLELIIDPTVRFSVNLGGSSGRDDFAGVAVDSQGYIYAVGTARSTDFPTTEGAFQRERKGNSNLFVVKLDPKGERVIFSTYLGGSGRTDGVTSGIDTETAWAIAVDDAGNIYVAGSTLSSDYPALAPVVPWDRNSAIGVITKLSPDGTRVLFSVGLPVVKISSIRIDTSGSVSVAGIGLNMKGTPGVLQEEKRPLFAGKLDSSGKVLFLTHFGGSGEDVLTGMATDECGDIYISGWTRSVDFPVTAGAYQTWLKNPDCREFVRCSDGFVAKINSTGTALLYATYYGGSRDDYIYGITVDDAGNAYVTGSTESDDFPVTSDSWQFSHNGNNPSGFLLRLNAEGSNVRYATYFGGNSNRSFEAGLFAALTDGIVYIAGISYGNLETNAVPELTPIQAGRGERLSDVVVGLCPTFPLIGIQWFRDGFVAAFDTREMKLVFSSYLGGISHDVLAGLTVTLDGDAVVVGNSSREYGYSRAWPLPGSKSLNNFATRISLEGTSPVIRRDWIRDPATLSRGAAFFGGNIVTVSGLNITTRDGTACAAPLLPLGMAGEGGPCGAPPLPTELDGVSVHVNGQNVPIYSVSRESETEKVTVILPWVLRPAVQEMAESEGYVLVGVTREGSQSLPIVVQYIGRLGYYAFPILLVQKDGSVLARRADGSVITKENPARRGEVIILYGIGMGPVEPPVTLGEAAPEEPRATVTAAPSIAFGPANSGVRGDVLSCGLTPGAVGIYQIEVKVPQDAPTGTTRVSVLYTGSEGDPIYIQ